MAGEQPEHGTQVTDGVGQEGIPPQVQPDEVASRVGLEFRDLTGNEATLAKVREFAGTKLLQYEKDRDDLEDLWKDGDYMWTCGINATKRAADQTDSTQADVGDGIFFRQVRILASQDLSIWFSQPDPYRYVPGENENLEGSEEAYDDLANQWNMIGRYTRREDDIDRKVFNIMFARRKYGNQLLLCVWDREVKRVIEKTPDGSGGFKWGRVDRVVKDCPTLVPWPIWDVYLDRYVGDIQRQNCIILTRLVDSGFLHSQAAAGFYTGIDDVGPEHFWEGDTRTGTEGEADIRETHQENRGMEPSADDTRAGQFREYNVFCKVPIDEDGNWSKTVAPDWHWFTFIHTVKKGPCVRGEANRDPDGEFPGFMDHVYPDDPDIAYHIGDATITKPDFDEKVTRKNQLFDNLHLMNNRPLLAVQGEVYSNDVTYSQEKVLWVENVQTSMREMDAKDTTGTAIPVLDYIDQNSDKTLGTVSTISGESGLGARASANEAEKVYRGASKPHTMLAKYHFLGWPDWYANKKRRLWEVYGDPDRVVRLTHEKMKHEIRLGDLHGNFDVEVRLVDEFSEDLVQDQNLAFMNQSVIPHFLDVIEKPAYLSLVARRFKFDPTEFVKQHQDVDAAYFARLRIDAMVEEGSYDPPRPGENLAAHLKEAQGYLVQFAGIDRSALDGDPRLRNLDLVEQYVAELKFLLSEQAAAGQLPGAPGNQSEGEVAGNAIAARSPGAVTGGLPVAR